MLQNFNYHGHTKRCGHAAGEDEEYIISAIQNGYKKIGVSDHAPYRNGYQLGERMAVEELPYYIESLKHLQEKYKDQIEIRIGLEFEYFEKQLDELKKYKEMFDYLIIGQHGPALYEEEFYTANSDEDVLKYAHLIEKACQQGLPDIIAHPDLYMFSKPEFNDAAKLAAHMICKAAQDYHIPLEVNLNGLKYGKRQIGNELRYTYPYRGFWEIAQAYDVKVVYGLDAHFPSKYADFECFDIVNEEILKGLSLDFLNDLSFEKKL